MLAQMPFAALGQEIGSWVVSVLAIAGAGALGYFLTTVCIVLICKMALHKPAPRRVTKLVSILGGVTVALFVGFLAFHGGGGGLGFGPGFGFGGGDKTDPGEISSAASPKTNPEKTDTTKGPPSSSMSIRMLGGDKAPRIGGDFGYYQPEPGKEAYTLDKLKPLIRERMQDKPDAPAIKEIVIVIEKDSVAHNHDAVLKLKQFAQDQGLTVSVRLPASP